MHLKKTWPSLVGGATGITMDRLSQFDRLSNNHPADRSPPPYCSKTRNLSAQIQRKMSIYGNNKEAQGTYDEEII